MKTASNFNPTETEKMESGKCQKKKKKNPRIFLFIIIIFVCVCEFVLKHQQGFAVQLMVQGKG